MITQSPVWFHSIDKTHAVREGRFKYHARHGVFFGNPADFSWAPMRDCGPWLFDLDADPDELDNLVAGGRSVPAREHLLTALVDSMLEADDLTLPFVSKAQSRLSGSWIVSPSILGFVAAEMKALAVSLT